jgi:hypothetical protein
MEGLHAETHEQPVVDGIDGLRTLRRARTWWVEACAPGRREIDHVASMEIVIGQGRVRAS